MLQIFPPPAAPMRGLQIFPPPSITPSTPFHDFIEVHFDADDTDTDSGILAPHMDAAEGRNAALADSNVYTCPTCHTPLATPTLTMASAPVAPPTTPVTAIIDIIPTSATGATSSTNSSDTWYTITIGRNVGVFQGWLNVGPLVNGVTGFCVKKFSTRAAAMAAFQQAEGAGLVQVRQ
ncbi:hypothetical protein C0992_006995 [Termitomyces sp. T32_za158]|nr:hypothetical protein C0992_006995 [Termitomyces sp. T32_za158]